MRRAHWPPVALDSTLSEYRYYELEMDIYCWTENTFLERATSIPNSGAREAIRFLIN